MGVYHYLVNHENTTFFELNKGPWYNIDLLMLYNPILFVDYFLKISEEELCCEFDRDYLEKLVVKLFDFVKGSTPNKIKVINDCCDDAMWMRRLKYKCVGSRFGFENEKEYMKEIESQNYHLKEKIYISEKEISKLQNTGWNLKWIVQQKK